MIFPIDVLLFLFYFRKLKLIFIHSLLSKLKNLRNLSYTYLNMQIYEFIPTFPYRLLQNFLISRFSALDSQKKLESVFSRGLTQFLLGLSPRRR